MWQSKLAIESQGRLQRHKGPLGSDPPGEGFIEPPRFVLADTCESFDSRRAQALKTSAGIDRIWIVHGRDDTLHAGCDDGFGAWSCATGVIARLERHVQSRAARFFARRLQCHDFRVVARFVLMKALADNLAFAHDNAAYRRIRAGKANAFAGKRQRMLHEANGVFVHGSVEEGIGVRFSVERHHVVDLLAGADEAYGQAQLARDGNDDAAFGRAIEFGKNDSGDSHGGSDFARLRMAVLPSGGVENAEKIL